MTTVLLATRDPVLLDELHRLTAAAGVAAAPAPDATAALRAWPTAGLVLAGADLAEALVGLDPPRREGVVLVSPTPAGDRVLRRALELGAEQVAELPDGAPWLAARLADLADEGARPGRLVAVLGGSGGAGATTFACALGQAAALGVRTLVVDADPLGPGLDRVLGLDDEPGVRWGDLAASAGRVSGRSLRRALPGRDGLAVLTWAPGGASPPAPTLVRECLAAGRRGHSLVVVDLPRAPGPVAEEVLVRCDLVLVVAAGGVAAAASAVRTARGLPDPRRAGLVVRGPGLEAADLAAVTDLPLLAAMRDQRGLAESVDLGLGPLRRPRGPLARAAHLVLDHLLSDAVPGPGEPS